MRIKSAINQVSFVFLYYACFNWLLINSIIETTLLRMFNNFIIFPHFLNVLCDSGLTSGNLQPWQDELTVLIQNFLAHPVSSCTSSLHFWFLIRFISRLHASMCVYMPYSKHKNIKLFGWCPFQQKMDFTYLFQNLTFQISWHAI